jgi:hypothetical protein
MPNWCINSATIKCPSKEIYEKLIAAIIEKNWFKTFAPLGLDPAEYEDGWDFKTACEIWNTKWDAAEIEITNRDDVEYILDVSFDTAWCPPLGVYEIMGKNFDIETTAYYYELGCCFFGRYIKNKNEKINESFEIPSSHEELVEIRKVICSDLDDFMSPTWEQLEEEWLEEQELEQQETTNT